MIDYPWILLDGEDTAWHDLEDAIVAAASRLEWTDVGKTRLPMSADRCRPATSMEIAQWLVEGLSARVPEWVQESEYLSEDADRVPDIDDSYWPDIVRALIPWVDDHVCPDQITAYCERIEVTAADWRDFGGVIVTDDGLFVRWANEDTP